MNCRTCPSPTGLVVQNEKLVCPNDANHESIGLLYCSTCGAPMSREGGQFIAACANCGIPPTDINKLVHGTKATWIKPKRKQTMSPASLEGAVK
jgi:hypothetical protein